MFLSGRRTMAGGIHEPEQQAHRAHQEESFSPVTHEASGDHFRHEEHPSPLPPDDAGDHPPPGQPTSPPVHDGQGPGVHGSHSRMLENYRNRCIVSMILTVPILILPPT